MLTAARHILHIMVRVVFLGPRCGPLKLVRMSTKARQLYKDEK
jgi:hypothetical protein